MHQTLTPDHPGWYIHVSAATGYQCYRVAMEDIDGHPELPAHAVAWSAGHQYPVSMLPGTWYGPLPLEALVREVEAGAWGHEPEETRG
jgi:hypothetical protein